MILITGGGGFLGLNTARSLVDMGQEVLLVRRQHFEVPAFLTSFLNTQVKIVLGDIMELPVLYGLIKEYNVDSIIHLAMLREHTGTHYQILKVNVDGTTEILEAARVFGLKRVTFCSSLGVYRETKNLKILQEDIDLPVESPGYISATKKIGEQICQLYAREYGLSVPIIRPSGIWGPMYGSGFHFVMDMVKNAVDGKPLDLSKVCGQRKRHFAYARDCAKATALVHLAPTLKHDIYNMSDGVLRCWDDFAEVIKELIPGAEIKLGTTRGPKDVDEPPMNIERIKEDVGFVPEYDLKRALTAYIEWVKHGKYI